MERDSGQGLDIGVKTGLGVCRQAVGKNPESVAGIELSYGGFPLSRDGSIHLSRQSGGTELTQKFVDGVVREAEVGANKILIENRRAEKKTHLLFFDGLPRRRQDMASPGKDRARNLPVQSGENANRSFPQP